MRLLLKIISILLTIKVVFGVVYILLGWQATLGNWVIPMWMVVAGIIVDGYLAYLACKFSKGKK